MSDLKPITKESMNEFVTENISFCSAVKAMLIQWGNDGDMNSLDHFREFVVVVAMEAIERFKEHHKSKNWKNYN